VSFLPPQRRCRCRTDRPNRLVQSMLASGRARPGRDGRALRRRVVRPRLASAAAVLGVRQPTGRFRRHRRQALTFNRAEYSSPRKLSGSGRFSPILQCPENHVSDRRSIKALKGQENRALLAPAEAASHRDDRRRLLPLVGEFASSGTFRSFSSSSGRSDRSRLIGQQREGGRFGLRLGRVEPASASNDLVASKQAREERRSRSDIESGLRRE
jgi:hypothetical protein